MHCHVRQMSKANTCLKVHREAAADEGKLQWLYMTLNAKSSACSSSQHLALKKTSWIPTLKDRAIRFQAKGVSTQCSKSQNHDRIWYWWTHAPRYVRIASERLRLCHDPLEGGCVPHAAFAHQPSLLRHSCMLQTSSKAVTSEVGTHTSQAAWADILLRLSA